MNVRECCRLCSFVIMRRLCLSMIMSAGMNSLVCVCVSVPE